MKVDLVSMPRRELKQEGGDPENARTSVTTPLQEEAAMSSGGLGVIGSRGCLPDTGREASS